MQKIKQLLQLMVRKIYTSYSRQATPVGCLQYRLANWTILQDRRINPKNFLENEKIQQKNQFEFCSLWQILWFLRTIVSIIFALRLPLTAKTDHRRRSVRKQGRYNRPDPNLQNSTKVSVLYNI